MKVAVRPFGVTKDGNAVQCFRMEHESGMVAEVLDYGATLRALWLRESHRRLQVCMGYETLQAYEDGTAYAGAIVGRCAGRIAGGAFTLKGTDYHLPCNQGANHLHGGIKGFDRHLWQSQLLEQGIRLFRHAPAGEEGYPGGVDVAVTYLFEPDGTLRLILEGKALDDTVLSMTHHGYWNLSGRFDRAAEGHLFWTPANQVAAIRPDGIPTGELMQTEGTPFDFAKPALLAERWNQKHPQLEAGSGFDHTFLVQGKGLRRVCGLLCPKTGVAMEVFSTLPGIHLYTGNFLKPIHSAIALEPQYIPDAPNHPEFPSVELEKGSSWTHEICYRFTKLTT